MDARGTAPLIMEHLGRLAENHGVLSALDEARVFVTGRPDTSVVKSADMPILEDLADQQLCRLRKPDLRACSRTNDQLFLSFPQPLTLI
jgi:hypothetical protein